MTVHEFPVVFPYKNVGVGLKGLKHILRMPDQTRRSERTFYAKPCNVEHDVLSILLNASVIGQAYLILPFLRGELWKQGQHGIDRLGITTLGRDWRGGAPGRQALLCRRCRADME